MEFESIRYKLSHLKQTKFGTSVPDIKKLAKLIARDNYKEFIESNDNSSFELKLLHAFVLGYAKDDIETILKYFERFMPQVDLMKYKNSKKEFESRIVSVVLLSHYLNDNYIDKVIKVLNELNTDDYYSQMGVAWAVATVMAKYPKKCLDYLNSKECNLGKITYNKSLQNIRESLRVSDEIKRTAKGLKRA